MMKTIEHNEKHNNVQMQKPKSCKYNSKRSLVNHAFKYLPLLSEQHSVLCFDIYCGRNNGTNVSYSISIATNRDCM